MRGKALFVVRAEVTDEALRRDFDRWYEAHLAEAVAAFGIEHGWRCWSRSDPKIHCAFYEFADVDRIEAMLGSAGFRALVADFDRHWGKRIPRSREILEVAGTAP
jgi:hypothetical protein